MRLNLISLVLTTLLVAGCASEPKRFAGPEDPFAMPIGEFMEETELLRVGLVQGEPRELEESELERFDEITEQMTKLINGATELEQVGMYNRHRLYELRSEMVKLVIGDSEPEKVCFRQHTTGTRLKGSMKCYTLEELERRRFEARQLMDHIQSHPQGTHPDS